MNRADGGRPSNPRSAPHSLPHRARISAPIGAPPPRTDSGCRRLGWSQLPKAWDRPFSPPSRTDRDEDYGQVFGSSGPVMRKTTVGAFFRTTCASGPAVHFACGGYGGLPASIRSRVATT
jgi:hypothetical protein